VQKVHLWTLFTQQFDVLRREVVQKAHLRALFTQQFDVLREEVVQKVHLRTLFTQLLLHERIILQIRLLCTKGHSSEWPFVYDCALFID